MGTLPRTISAFCAVASTTAAIAGFCEDLKAVISDAPSGFATVRDGEIAIDDGKSTAPKGKYMLLGNDCYIQPSGSMYRCAIVNVPSETAKEWLAKIEKCELQRSEKDWVVSGALDFGSDASLLTDTIIKVLAPNNRIVTAAVNTRVVTKPKPTEQVGTYLYVNLRVFRDETPKR